MRFVTTAIAVGVAAMTGWVAAEASASQAAGSTSGSFAYVDIQRVAEESAEGQTANTRVDELSQQKVAEIEARNAEGQNQVAALDQELQEAQQKLQQGQNVISAEAAATLQRQITRLQRDIERTTADAQADIQRMSPGCRSRGSGVTTAAPVGVRATTTPGYRPTGHTARAFVPLQRAAGSGVGRPVPGPHPGTDRPRQQPGPGSSLVQ